MIKNLFESLRDEWNDPYCLAFNRVFWSTTISLVLAFVIILVIISKGTILLVFGGIYLFVKIVYSILGLILTNKQKDD